MFERFAIVGFVRNFCELPVDARRKKLKTALQGVIDNPVFFSRIREALPERAQPPFDDLVAAVKDW